MEQVWEIFSAQLYFVHFAFRAQVLAFVLMNNHFHMILLTPEANLSEIMAWFMRETSRELTRASGRINQCYGGRHFRSLIGSPLYYLHAYKYLYLNPVKAGLVGDVLSYRYSSIRGLLGLQKLEFPVAYDDTLFSDVDGCIRWLNRKPSEENWETVRKALRRKEFTLPMINRMPHPLEEDAL